jgi:two-component SAPR family response regulator
MKKVVLSISALKAMNFLLETVIAPKHTVYLVQNVIEGMHLLRNKTIVDFVIVDLDYDTRENIEFINHIKNSRLYSRTKIIALSSMADLIVVETELNIIDHVFSKPFSPEQLLGYINNLSIPNMTFSN